MSKKDKLKNVEEEIAFTREDRINIDLIEILAGDRHGYLSQIAAIEGLKEELGDKLYTYIIYHLTHMHIKDAKRAKTTFNEIIEHKKTIEKQLNRSVGIQVASIDYLKNIKKMVKKPTVIEEGKIRKLASTAVRDDTTEAYDKKLLYHDLEKEAANTRRYDTRFSVLMIDIDNLKQINDKSGHMEGDRVLKRVGEVLKNTIRDSDMLYRFGGDEFVALLPRTDARDAEKTSMKLLAAIENIRTGKDSKKHKVTASIGAASFSRNNIDKPVKIIERADTALYKAKSAGKNCYRIVTEKNKAVKHKITEKFSPSATKERQHSKGRHVIKGSNIAPGIVFGKAFVYHDILTKRLEFRELEAGEINCEWERIETAVSKVKEDLVKARNNAEVLLEKKIGAIFDAHRLMLNDPEVIKELEEEMQKEKLNAEQIVKNVFSRLADRFKKSGSELIRDRADDVLDLKRRVLTSLAGSGHRLLGDLPPGSIIITEKLLPSDTINLLKCNVAGIITQHGSKSSHAALLARSMNIPYIANLNFSIKEIENGCNLIVDADGGRIIVNPGSSEIKSYNEIIERKNAENEKVALRAKDLKLESGGRQIKVLANVNSKQDVEKAYSNGCDGIGLFRIEQIYMRKKVPPTEDEIVTELEESLAHMEGKDVIIRLLDIGGDKTLPYFDLDDEIHSFLGMRGVRLLLSYPHLLENQFRALARLSGKYSLKILIPMVTVIEDVIELKRVFEKVGNNYHKENGSSPKNIMLGSMIETPAAVTRVADILKHVDFVSIGTNDLIQYIMASGRENSIVAHYYDAGSDIVLEYVKKVVDEAEKAGKECILCGELASDTEYTGKLLKLGLRNFSVSAANIPKVKNRIAEILGINR